VIVLDTHTWLWWISRSPELSISARNTIEAADAIVIPAIVCWEIALLVAKGRLPELVPSTLAEFLHTVLRHATTQLAPLTPAIAVRASQLGPDFHKDPADRLIAATALELNAPLVTRDDRMRAFAALQTTW
jgi:PIN domain nuclease of toxin-antitoxin system